MIIVYRYENIVQYLSKNGNLMPNKIDAYSFPSEYLAQSLCNYWNNTKPEERYFVEHYNYEYKPYIPKPGEYFTYNNKKYLCINDTGIGQSCYINLCNKTISHFGVALITGKIWKFYTDDIVQKVKE